MSLRPFRRAEHGRPSRILAAALALCPAPVVAANWDWIGGTGNWSVPGNWTPAGPPASSISTGLGFGGAAAFSATNNLGADFTLNSLVLQSLAEAESKLQAASAERLVFDAAAGGQGSILQNGTGGIHISMGIVANAPLHFAGTGPGITRLTGAIGGNAGLHFDTGSWQLSSAGSTFNGGVTVNLGAFLELRSLTGPVNLARSPASPGILGSRTLNPVVINGGTIKVTTLGIASDTPAGASMAFGSGMNASLAITFGSNGGVFDLTNTNPSAPDSHAGTIGWSGANPAGGDLALNLSNTAPAIVRFNGGQLGLSTYADPESGGWSVAQNALRFRQYSGTGPLRIEVTHGAMTRAGTGADNAVEILAPVTYRGEIGGDPTSGPAGIVNPGTSLNTGRIAVDRSSVTYSGGVTFEDALQVASVNGASRLGGSITLAGTASGHPATVTFTGRATSNPNALTSEQLDPRAAGPGQNSLWLGNGSGVAITIENGATGIFDARTRVDQSNHSGVLLDGTAVIQGGGTLRIAQSLSNYSPIAGIALADVGDIVLRGAVEGRGSTSVDAVLDLRVPAPREDGTIANGTPAPLSSEPATLTGLRPHAGFVAEETHQIIIHGTGFGGLRVEANARPDALFSTAILPGGPSKPDPVSNLTKLNDYLTPARLAGITGSGGYLTAAPAGQMWSFPAGGEWLDTVAVGLRVTDHHADGTDVSFSGVTAFRHNVAVDSGAIVDFGAAPFAFGPAAPMGGIGTLHGNGAARGNLSVAIGGRIAPGMGGIGALSVEQAAVAGGIEIETNGSAADLLAVTGALVLEATSQLIVPGTSILAPRNYKVIVAESRAGTFGSATGLPASHSVSYSRPGEIWLAFTGGRSVTWTGDASSAWDHTSQNWTGPTAFVESDRVVFNDSAPAARRSVAISGGDVAPASILVDTNESYTLLSSAGSSITGTGELVKTGAGTLTLSGPAAFEGGVLIQQGILETAGAEAIPDAGKVLVEAGAQLNLGGAETINELIVEGSVNSSDLLAVDVLRLQGGAAFQAPLVLRERLLKSGAPLVLPQPIDLAGGIRQIDVAGSELTLGGALSNGGFDKTGAGTLVLAAANALPAGIIVTEGTLRSGVAGAVPAGANVTVAAAGTLDLNGQAHTLGSLSTSGTITTGGAPLTVASLGGTGGSLSLGAAALQVNQAGTTRYDGAISTSGPLVKAGSGSLALGGANAIGAGIQVSEGVLRIAGNGAAASGTIMVSPTASLVAEATIGAEVTLAGGTLGARFSGVSLTGDLIVPAGATATITVADPEELTSASEVVITGTLRGDGDIVVLPGDTFNSADNSPGLRLRGTGASDYAGVITAGQRVKLELQSSVAGPFSPAGSGQVVLTAGTASFGRSGSYSQLNLRNNHTGDTILGTDVVIAGNGVVNFGPVSDVVEGQHLAPENSRIILGNLRIGDGQEASVNKNGDVSQVVQFESVTLTGGEAVFSPNRANFGFSKTSDLALGPIGELAPGSGIVMAGMADLFLTDANTYTGRTVIQAGTTWLAAPGALPAATALEMTGGTLLLQSRLGPAFSQTVSSLSGEAAALISNTAGDGNRDLTVNQAADTVFAGRLEGELNLIKLGAGKLSLSGIAAHEGATTIGGGTLSVSSGGVQGAISGSVLVQNGATLAGSGSVGSLSVAAGGRVEPGEGIGVLNSGAIAFDSDSILSFELNGTLPGSGHDQIVLFGSLTLSGPVQLELQLGFQPALFDVFTLILNNGAQAIAGGGLFTHDGNLLENGEIFSVTSGAFQQAFEIRYDGNDGNDVLLTAVPEPSAVVFFICGALLCARRRRG